MRTSKVENVRWIRVVVASVLLAGALSGRADDESNVTWRTIVGLVQAGNQVGSGTGQVTGGGQPWTTLGGHASVQLDTGHVRFRVEGLVLAGGNGIGTPLPITSVKGTLVCNTSGSAGGGNSVLVDTQSVDLDVLGNAQFEGDVGTLPGACSSEQDIAFLVRIAGSGPADGRWIANGAVRRR